LYAKFIKLFLLLLAVLSPGRSIASEEIYLGVMEFKDEQPTARVLFLNKGSWQSVKKQDLSNKLIQELREVKSLIDWDIYYDGGTKGQISTKFNKQCKNNTSGSCGLLEITSKNYVPFRKKIRGPFYYSWLGQHKYRPLVLSSKKSVKDPMGWKLSKLKSTIKNKFKSRLVEELNSVVPNCRFDKDNNEVLYNQRINFENVELLKSYVSKNGLNLFAARVTEEYKCDGPSPDEYSTYWFYGKGDKLKLLGKDLSPVDAGDFDSDGKSEWMFMYSGYNESGYCLFFENFSKKVEFNWVYH
jgi:ribosomal protein S18